MRLFFAVFAILFAGLTVQASPQCTGLQCQQVSCPAGTTTSITGTIYAPNGTDPLPGVLVYIPNAPVDPFVDGVADPSLSCLPVGTAPSGSPLVGAVTAVDGTFRLTNVPVGTSIPLVVVTGRWRRQTTVDTSAASCGNTSADPATTRMPKNRSEGDIPKFAIATGSADQVECILRKVGIDDSEFTDSTGTGRIQLFAGSAKAGAVATTNSSVETETDLMADSAVLNQYDVLMLPCEGTAGASYKTNTMQQNLLSFSNQGGRVYASHYSYAWMKNVYSSAANWITSASAIADSGVATVNTNFEQGATLQQWLQEVHATTTPGQMTITAIKKDQNGVNASTTKTWLTLNSNSEATQFVWDTPISATNQCGRVLFNEYHVEDGSSSANEVFPGECSAPTTPMTPQEKLLEYSLFALTSNGSPAALAPDHADFGTENIGFTTAAQTFTWTNNATFSTPITLMTASGDFVIASSNNCNTVAAGASCTIDVVFTPAMLGTRTGTLTVGAAGTTLTSALTGNGIPGFAISATSLTFSSVDVGGTTSQDVMLTNTAPGALTLPAFVVTGDYTATSNCPATVPGGASCTITVHFSPAMTGTRAGTLDIGSGTGALTVSMTGNGVDFSIALTPESGTAIGGVDVITRASLVPIAGYNNAVQLSCTTTASASTCTVSNAAFNLPNSTLVPVTITTTPKYTVVGYGGMPGWLSLFALAGGLLVWAKRRKVTLARYAVITLVLATGVFTLNGCSGKLPAQNASYTPTGANTYTVTATDGIITHSATYTLHVTAK